MDLIPQVIALTDSIRLPLSIDADADRHKEWHHFCIVDPRVQALVNLSLMHLSETQGSWSARVIVLVKERCSGVWDGGPWDGDVDDIPSRDVIARRGKIDLVLGHNHVRYQDGCFHLSVSLESRPITLHLKMRPTAYPLLRRNTPIGSGDQRGGKISWVVVPRLLASGTIVVGRRVYDLVDVPSYHDHNWGSWSWGDDFAWQWGYAISSAVAQSNTSKPAWSVVFDRLTDRSRNSARELKLSLWKGEKLHRLYLQDEIEVRQHGFVTQTRANGSHLAKFPRPMGLLAPQLATDVPRHFEVSVARHSSAGHGGDRLECSFEAEDVAQIILPNETDLGVTVINEVSGVMRLEGRVSGERVEMEGRGFFEFLT